MPVTRTLVRSDVGCMTFGEVKQLLGHSSIVLTSSTYGHVLEHRQRQVAQAMEALLGG